MEILTEPAIIRTENLTKRYGEKTAVDGLNLTVREGEIFGLLGPNGAGKTTTIRMLLGLSEPSGGRACIDGLDCTRETAQVKRIVGYLPDQMGFYGDMTGRENLRFTGRLNGLGGESLEREIDRLLERVGMSEAADRKTGTYSRGMRQRLGIADVLVKDPRVVIMDEPTLGIDPEGMRELMELIRELAAHDGRTVLISSHQLYQIQQICDRVGLFVEGRLIACGGIAELARQVEQKDQFILEAAADPDDGNFVSLLRELPGVRAVARQGGAFVVCASCDVRQELLARSLQAGYTLRHFRQRGGDLDEIYHRYFEQAEEEAAAAGERGAGRTGRIFGKRG